MHNVFTLLQSTAAFLGLDQKRCVACFTPYSPIADCTFADLYEENTNGSLHGDNSKFSTPPQLCPDCLQELAPRTKGYCPICGMLYSKESGTPSRCTACIQSPPPWKHMTLYGAYEGILRELILQHKFHNRLETGLALAKLLTAVYKITTVVPKAIVPMPLHPRKLQLRGHNQTLLPAKLLSKKFHIPLQPLLLRRILETAPQASLNKKERRANIRKAFQATVPSFLKGAHILLLDDIATTCTTLEQAAKALLAAGAGSIEVAIIARTPEPSDTHK